MDNRAEIYTRHRSPDELCHAVRLQASPHFDVLTARPWNKFEPATSLWWLVPVTEWPAFRHAKFFFDWTDGSHTALWTGIYVEKGLDPKIAEFFHKKSGIMQPDWDWYRLLRSIERGQLEDRVRRLAASLPTSVCMLVQGAYVRDADFDPEMPGYERDEYIFHWDTDRSEFRLSRDPRTDGHVLGDLSKVKQFDDLHRELEMLTANAWLWVDFMLMVSLRIDDSGSPPEHELWDDITLWTRFLEPISNGLL